MSKEVNPDEIALALEQHIAESKTNIPELEDWGRYIRNEKMPGPGRMSPVELRNLSSEEGGGDPIKGNSVWSFLLGDRRDEDDQEPEVVDKPDRCERVNHFVYTWLLHDDPIKREYARLLMAFYCQHACMMRSCCSRYPKKTELERKRNAQEKREGYNRYTLAEFQRLLYRAEGAFVEGWRYRY